MRIILLEILDDSKYEMKIDLNRLIKTSLITITLMLLYYQFVPDKLIFKNILLVVYLIVVYFLLPEVKEIFSRIIMHLFKYKCGNSI
jgi:hypothetical protein